MLSKGALILLMFDQALLEQIGGLCYVMIESGLLIPGLEANSVLDTAGVSVINLVLNL
jgi:hypothetical protein